MRELWPEEWEATRGSSAKVSALGVGGTNPTVTGQRRQVPTRESGVLVPSEMYAIGDGTGAGWNGNYQDIGIADSIGPHNARSRQGQEDSRRLFDVLAKVRPAHRTRLSVVLCDGHVESPKIEGMIWDISDAARRRWNKDHEPHPENLY